MSLVLPYFKTQLESHAVHQSKTKKKTDGGWKEATGEMGLCLGFTTTMEDVCFVLLPLFGHTVYISWQENYITSCVRAFDWVTGPHGINGSFFGTLLHDRGLTDSVVCQMHNLNRKREVRPAFPPMTSAYFVVFCCLNQWNVAETIRSVFFSFSEWNIRIHISFKLDYMRVYSKGLQYSQFSRGKTQSIQGQTKWFNEIRNQKLVRYLK